MSALFVLRQGMVVGREDFRAFWNLRTWFSAWMLRIGTSAALWVLVGRMLGSEQKLSYLLIGNAVMAGPIAVGMVVPASTWDRWEGTYSLLVASPSSMVPAVLGRTAIWCLHGLGTALACFAILCAGFGLSLPVARPLVLGGLVALLALVCMSSHAFALMLGALVNRTPSLRNVLQNSTMPVLMALCGVSVPIDFWSPGLQALAYVLPISHGLMAIRTLLEGGAPLRIANEASLELLVGLGWLAAAVFTMDWLANRGRADGSIDVI